MTVHSFREVVELWDTPAALADELGVNPETTRKWWERSTIPSGWWLPILQTERAAAVGLSADTLVKLARLHFEARA